MTDYAPIEATRPGRGRAMLVIVLVALAFLAGIALMGYAMKNVAWFKGGTAAAPVGTAPTAQPTATADFSPAQPLNARGEIDTATLETREAALAGQLSSLESRTATVSADAAAAGSQAARAEGLLVAFAARRALDRGMGLGYLEEQLRVRFAPIQPRAVAIAIQAAHQPVTLEDLRQGLDAIAPDIATVSTDDWFAAFRRELGNLVVLRKSGTPSPLPADRLLRARRLLDGGQVDAARAEVARLPGARDAGNWLAAADRYMMARRALDVIENAALLGQVAPAPAAAPMPVPVGPAAPTAAVTQP